MLPVPPGAKDNRERESRREREREREVLLLY
jgi:hypothetical protein